MLVEQIELPDWSQPGKDPAGTERRAPG